MENPGEPAVEPAVELTDEELLAADPMMRRVDDLSPLLNSIRFELTLLRERHAEGALALDTLQARGEVSRTLNALHGQTNKLLHSEIDTLTTGHLADREAVRAKVQVRTCTRRDCCCITWLCWQVGE